MMILLSDNIGGTIASFIILLLWLAAIIIIRPYTNNIRPIGNIIMQLVISIFFLHARCEVDSS